MADSTPTLSHKRQRFIAVPVSHNKHSIKKRSAKKMKRNVAIILIFSLMSIGLMYELIDVSLIDRQINDPQLVNQIQSSFINFKTNEKKKLFSNGTFGWLWTVFGETKEWRWRELIQSARSVYYSSTKYKLNMCLVTDNIGIQYIFKYPNLLSNLTFLFKDNIIIYNESNIEQLDDVTNGWLKKIKIMQSTPYDNTIFVDTDTFCIDPYNDIDSLFDVLKSFDIATGHDWTAYRQLIIPQFIIGIVVFQMNLSIKYMFKEWVKETVNYRDWWKKSSVRDQDVFRRIIVDLSQHDPYLQSVRIYVYPPETSCELGSENTTSFQFGPVDGATGHYKLPNIRKCRFIHSHYINYKKEEFLHIYN